MSTPFTDLSSFLAWITGPTAGGFAIITWFLSWAFEKADFWQKLEGRIKLLITFLVSSLFAVGAYFLSLNEALVAQIDPVFKVLLSTAIVWLSSQVAHRVDKNTSMPTVLVTDECFDDGGFDVTEFYEE